MKRGLHAYIYRADYNSPNNAYGQVQQVTIIGPEIEAVGGAVFEPDEKSPAVRLKHGAFNSVIAVPCFAEDASDLEMQKGLCGPMMGGAYIATSDSRFSEAVEKMLGHRFYGAIPLHDYYETWEEYNAHSRD